METQLAQSHNHSAIVLYRLYSHTIIYALSPDSTMDSCMLSIQQKYRLLISHILATETLPDAGMSSIFPMISRHSLYVIGSSHETELNIFLISHCFGAKIQQELSNVHNSRIHQPVLPPALSSSILVPAMTVVTSFLAGYRAPWATIQQFSSLHSSLMFMFPLHPNPIDFFSSCDRRAGQRATNIHFSWLK